MVLSSGNPLFKMDKIRDDIELPIIDLHSTEAPKLIVKACEEFGFFKVINHGVPQHVITRMEEETYEFFAKPGPEKQRAGPANPFGYGCKNIGVNGDMGEIEYLLFETSPSLNSYKSDVIATHDPNKFRLAVSGYVEAVKELACHILDLIEQGLLGPYGPHMSELIRRTDSDSVLRLNHYPSPTPTDVTVVQKQKIGFGEHSDPQILTLLRSNAVGGLQISLHDGVWIPVNPHPSAAFCVNVGDLLQVMTNGRFTSVKHRAVVSSCEARTSMAFFAAPPLQANITRLPMASGSPPMYRSFTWAEYKKATYTRRLGESRLNLFKVQLDDKHGRELVQENI